MIFEPRQIKANKRWRMIADTERYGRPYEVLGCLCQGGHETPTEAIECNDFVTNYRHNLAKEMDLGISQGAKRMGSSWKTSVCGWALLIAAVGVAINAFLDGDPNTVADFEGIMTAFALATGGGIGVAARDNNKTSESVGAGK